MPALLPTAHFADISHFQAVNSFHDVAAAGCPLVITKCTEGSHYTDKTYQPYADRVRSVPLIFGSYAFEDAGPEAPQVAHYMNVAHLKKGDLQPIIDAEAQGLTKDETFGALKDLMARGFRPILYCSLSFFIDVLGAPDWVWLWLAAYRDQLPDLPAGTKLWAWQHTDKAICPGIPHPCDMSYLYVPVEDLPKFCID